MRNCIRRKEKVHIYPIVKDSFEHVWDYDKETKANIKVVNALYQCLYIRDPLTAAHSLHMAHYSYELAVKFDKENAPLYFAGSLIHDIGKLGMPDHILKGKHILSYEERDVLKHHVADGYQILRGLGLPRILLDIVRYHHERFNGVGYLEGLQGEDIPLPGRIAAITDTYSALTSERPYTRAKSHNHAIHIMKEERDQFDPVIFEYFINSMKKG